jgi:CAAX protease family protein
MSWSPTVAPVEAIPVGWAPAPTGYDVLIGIGAAVLLLAASIVLSQLVPGLGLVFTADQPWSLLVQLALANLILLSAPVAVAWRRGWRVFRLLPLCRGRIALCACGGAAAGVLLAIVLQAIDTVTGLKLHGANAQLLDVPAMPPWGLVLFALIAAGTTPMIEELVFRGLLFGWLRRRLGLWLGAGSSAAVFGALHWWNGQALWAALIGFLLALLYERTGSLWASIAAHAGNNALAMALVFWIVR